MIWIPAITFTMGSPKSEKGRKKREGSQHEVTISWDFALGRFPATVEEYDRFFEGTKREKPGDRG